MKIAWFTPFCVESAIGRYSAVILDELVKKHEITVFATGFKRGHMLRPHLKTLSIDGKGANHFIASQASQHDIAVYNLGNFTPYHGDIHQAMQQFPGVAIVHDVANYGLFWGLTMNGTMQGNKAWLRELEYSHGPEARLWGERLIKGFTSLGRGQEDVLRYTFLRSCVRRAVGVVAHGEWAKRAIQAVTAAPVVHIDFPRFLGPAEGSLVDWAGSQKTSDTVHLLTFGAVNPNKAVDLVIEVIASSPKLRERVQFTIAGSMAHQMYVADLKRLIQQHQLNSVVKLVDRPSNEVLEKLVKQADIVINLRYPHLGECSGSLQEALFHAKPVVVWGHGYYDEFPADVVVKVRSLGELQRALERLVEDPCERAARARRGYEHARKRFQTPVYCQALEAFLEQCAALRVIASWTDRISDRIAEFGPGPHQEQMVARIAEELSQLHSMTISNQAAA